MPRVIESVEVVHNHPEGPDAYRVGYPLNYMGSKIADITEFNGVYLFFDEKDELLMEIKGCPVVVRYKEEVEESQ